MTPHRLKASDGTGDDAGPQMMTTGQESAPDQGASWQRAGRASRCPEDAGPDAGRRDAGRAARPSHRPHLGVSSRCSWPIRSAAWIPAWQRRTSRYGRPTSPGIEPTAAQNESSWLRLGALCGERCRRKPGPIFMHVKRRITFSISNVCSIRRVCRRPIARPTCVMAVALMDADLLAE